MGAPAARAYENASRWVDMGHDVTVLCGVPNHPVGEIYDGYKNKPWQKEEVDGIKVVRTWVYPTPNRKAWERIVNYGSFGFSSLTGSILIRKPDVIIGTSPQLLVALSSYMISEFKRVPFVFEVRDLWPETIEATGTTQNNFLIWTLRHLSDLLYRKAKQIVVVTNSFKDKIQKLGVNSGKIKIIPNGVDLELFKPSNDKNKKSNKWNEDFLVSYIGTLGECQGLSVVLKAAEKLEEFEDIHFLFVGEGAKKEQLKKKKRKKNLTNVEFLDKQPKSDIPKFLSFSNVSLVMLKKRKLFESVIPSKMFESMAMRNPVILGAKGESRNILNEADAGIAIEPENHSQLKDAILKLYRNKRFGEKLGRNGREYVKENYTRETFAKKYIKVLREL